MGLGGLNPLPSRLGGGPGEAAKAYDLLRRAVGEGGSAEDDSGIEGLWRRAKARALAAGTSAYRRAVLQAWPHLSTDALPYYERVLGIVPTTGTTEEDRRRAVVTRWTAKLSAVRGSLEDALQAIDARFSLVHVSHDLATATVAGRTFGPLDSSLETPAMSAATWAHYSTDHHLQVRFAAGYTGALTLADQRRVEAASDLLRQRLPAWVTFEVSTGDSFVVGESGLGTVGVS